MDLRVRMSRIETGKTGRHRTWPDITVYTTHFRSLLNYIFTGMKKLARERSPATDFRVTRG